MVPPMGRLPDNAHRILPEQLIPAQNCKPVDQRLRHQHAIEWVGVELRKTGHVQSGFLLQRQALDPMRLSLPGNKLRWRFWQWQAAEGVFDLYLRCY